jgi:cation diffusion facilitator CzcD-associated flavoprotein CzcO
MRKKRIAVIGGGTAGLHLIYALHKSQQFDITLFANRTLAAGDEPCHSLLIQLNWQWRFALY